MRLSLAILLAVFTLPAAGCDNLFDLTSRPIVVVEQPDIGTPDYAIGGSAAEKLAQVVTAPADSQLVDVALPLYGVSFTLQIQSVAPDGSPSGTVLCETLVNVHSTTSPDFPWERIHLPHAVPLAAGTQFAIVMRDGNAAISAGPAGDSYPGGHFYFDALPNQSGWALNSAFAGDDLPFRAWFQE